MIKKLLFNSFIFGITPHIAQLASILIMRFITPHLTKEDFGIHTTIITLALAFNVFNTLGFNILLSNSFIKHPSRYHLRWRFIYGSLSVWMFLFFFIQAAILYYLMPNEVEDKLLVVCLALGPNLLFGPVSTIAGLYYQLSEKPIPTSIRAVIGGNLAVFLNLYFIKYEQMGYMGWFWTSFIVTILINLSYWPLVNWKLKLKPIFVWKPRLLRSYLKISLPTVPHFYSSYLLESSVYQIMAVLKIPKSVSGVYASATKANSYGQAFVMALNTAFNPRIMRLYKEANQLLAKNLILFMQNLTFLATATAAIFSKEIIQFLFNNDELNGFYPLFIILVMGLNYRPMYIASSNMFFFYDQTKRLTLITFVGGLVFVIFNFLFLPNYGLIASAIIYFIVMQYIGYSGFLMKEYTQKSKINFRPFQYLIINTILVFVFYFTCDFEIWKRLIIYGLVGGYFALRAWRNINYLKKSDYAVL